MGGHDRITRHSDTAKLREPATNLSSEEDGLTEGTVSSLGNTAVAAGLKMVQDPVEQRDGANKELAIITFEDSESGFCLSMTDKFYQFVKRRHGGIGQMCELFMELREAVLTNPYGEDNIDEFADTDAGRCARIVQKIPLHSPLADIVPGKQLAVKTTGMDMEATRKYLELFGGERAKLTSQFQATRKLISLMERNYPDGFLGGLISVADVYAVLSEPQQEGEYEPRQWMLMEYIPNAQSVKQLDLVLSRGGVEPGFKGSQYPELATAVHGEYSWTGADNKEIYSFRELVRAMLENPVDVRLCEEYPFFSDLTGNNILETRDPNTNKPHYTIIDIQEKSPHY